MNSEAVQLDDSRGYSQCVTKACSQLKTLPGPKDPPSRWRLHLADKLAISSPHFLPTSTSRDCLSVPTPWQLASPRVGQPREQGQGAMSSTTQPHTSYAITTAKFHQSHRTGLLKYGRGIHRRMTSNRQCSLGTILEAGFYDLEISFQVKERQCSIQFQNCSLQLCFLKSILKYDNMASIRLLDDIFEGAIKCLLDQTRPRVFNPGIAFIQFQYISYVSFCVCYFIDLPLNVQCYHLIPITSVSILLTAGSILFKKQVVQILKTTLHQNFRGQRITESGRILGGYLICCRWRTGPWDSIIPSFLLLLLLFFTMKSFE